MCLRVVFCGDVVLIMLVLCLLVCLFGWIWRSLLLFILDSCLLFCLVVVGVCRVNCGGLYSGAYCLGCLLVRGAWCCLSLEVLWVFVYDVL